MLFFDLISWLQPYQIKFKRKLLFAIHAEVSNFSDEVNSGILDDAAICSSGQLNSGLGLYLTFYQTTKLRLGFIFIFL